MNPKIIKPIKKLSGEISLPGDKSISHRAVMLGAIASGETEATGILDCDDTNFTINAFREMGVVIEKKGSQATIIKGRGLKGLRRPSGPINVGNSGTSMRLLAGILAGQDFDAILSGDEGLSKRPMGRIIRPLSLMGVRIRAREEEYPPLAIKGGSVKPISYKMPIPSAQVKSAIIFAGLYAKGTTTVEEKFKSRDHTERMLKYFGLSLKAEGLRVSLEGGKELIPGPIEIPGDISSASFFIIGAALLKGSRIRINGVGINPTRAGVLNILSKMGAKIKILNRREPNLEPIADIVAESSTTNGTVIEESEIPSIIDELPIIFVLASLSKGKTIIKGAGELKVKETDRIGSMRANMEKMASRFRLESDDIVIEGVEKLKGGALNSFGDHRTCMAMAVAASAASQESVMDDVECINKSFPQFFETLQRLSQ